MITRSSINSEYKRRWPGNFSRMRYNYTISIRTYEMNERIHAAGSRGRGLAERKIALWEGKKGRVRFRSQRGNGVTPISETETGGQTRCAKRGES